MKKIDWQKLQEHAHEHKDLLFMVASPATDEIFVAFNHLSTFVRFPMETMDKGVVFNALRKSKFLPAIDAFMTGLMNSTGITEKEEGGELLKVLGGAMKGMGLEGSKLQAQDKDNAKKESRKRK